MKVSLVIKCTLSLPSMFRSSTTVCVCVCVRVRGKQLESHGWVGKEHVFIICGQRFCWVHLTWLALMDLCVCVCVCFMYTCVCVCRPTDLPQPKKKKSKLCHMMMKTLLPPATGEVVGGGHLGAGSGGGRGYGH